MEIKSHSNGHLSANSTQISLGQFGKLLELFPATNSISNTSKKTKHLTSQVFLLCSCLCLYLALLQNSVL